VKTKMEKQEKNPSEHEVALRKYIEENEEISEAIEVMKQTFDIRNLRPLSLDRFSYHSIQ